MPTILRPQYANVVNATIETPVLEWQDHSATPIKDRADIDTISNYLVRNRKWRDNLMFIMGINFGLRCSDLTQLKVKDIIRCNEQGQWEYRHPIWIREIKTAKRRVSKSETENENGESAEPQYKLKNPRPVYVNDAIAEAFDLFCKHGPDGKERQLNMEDYLFPGRGGKTPMTYQGVYSKWTRLMKGPLYGKMNRPFHASTHFMRKTFAYQYLLKVQDQNRGLYYLMKCFGHASPTVTLHYVGITQDEIENTIMEMNLGHRQMDTHNFDVDPDTLAALERTTFTNVVDLFHKSNPKDPDDRFEDMNIREWVC